MTSNWWEWLSWAWNASSLVMNVALLVVAVVAMRKMGGTGAVLLLAGAGVQFLGWILQMVPRFLNNFEGVVWWQFLFLGVWVTGSLLVTAGILFIVIRAGGMKERIAALEAIAAREQGSGGVSPSA